MWVHKDGLLALATNFKIPMGLSKNSRVFFPRHITSSVTNGPKSQVLHDAKCFCGFIRQI